MSEREPTRLTDDQLIGRALERLEAERWEGQLTDTEARIIASQHHGGMSSALYSFASTGAINMEALEPEIRLDLDTAIESDDAQDSLALNMLLVYLNESGDRPPVEGWHESTRW